MVGGFFAASYNSSQITLQETQVQLRKIEQDAQSKLREIELVHQYLPDLEHDGPRKKAALLAIKLLAGTDFVIELVKIYGGEAAADAVTEIGADAKSEAERAALFDAYNAILAEEPILSAIGPPEIHERTVDVVVNQPETRTRTVKVARTVAEQVPYTYTVTVWKLEQSTREVEKRDPKTGKPLLDANGKPVTETQTYTVKVPHEETREANRTVAKMVYDDREETYTVMVPHQETRLLQYHVYQHVDLDAFLEKLLKDRAMPFEAVMEMARNRLGVDPSQAAALRRKVRWRTQIVVSGPDAGKVRFKALPKPEVAAEHEIPVFGESPTIPFTAPPQPAPAPAP
jgi:hypothetical protein